uniref:Phosphoglycerate mutase-like protein 1 n=1 Tax=Nelumbo nucifera TaxID=4432 RepID=A0A822XHC6_NELNU|nr:TPA_asm: hypothetical protein HUJ06_019902 [Nelumbo nucifera]
MQAIPERAHDYGLENQLREQFQQHVIVMRHGDRIDNFQPLWVATASRPWDPPLTDTGKTRAFCTGRKLRKNLGFPIHRVFVSPFLRCIQTAAEAVSALCAVQDNPLNMTSENVAVDPSKLKVDGAWVPCLEPARHYGRSRENLRIPILDDKWCLALKA